MFIPETLSILRPNTFSMMKYTSAICFFLLAIVCSCSNSNQKTKQTLAEARKGFVTHLTKVKKIAFPAEEPPAELFSIVSYPSNIGNMTAYLGKIPNDSQLHPAIIWITGGFGNDIGDVWSEADSENDQSAAAYHKAGIVMMHPALRGGNGNPGSGHSTGGTKVLLAAECSKRFRAVFSFGPVTMRLD